MKYELTEQQIDFILGDIRSRGIRTEDLQLSLLDHICCKIENELEPGESFESFYARVLPQFFSKELKEIEEETILLLTFKHYYAMKKVMISTGIFSVFLFITGSVFKIMHWPGAGVLLFLGIGLLSILFLPLMFILKTKDTTSTRDKLILGLGALIGILFSAATLFSVMHWPGATALWISAVGCSAFLLIPSYFFTGIRNPDTKTNTIVTTIILVGATGLVFTMINLRPSYNQSAVKMYSYLESEALLQKVRMIRGNTRDAGSPIGEINDAAEELKHLILEGTAGVSVIPPDFEQQPINIYEGNLGPHFQPDQKGVVLFGKLQKLIHQYNTSNDDPRDDLPVNRFQGNIGSYSNYVVLNYLVQVQMGLASSSLAVR